MDHHPLTSKSEPKHDFTFLPLAKGEKQNKVKALKRKARMDLNRRVVVKGNHENLHFHTKHHPLTLFEF